MPNHLSLLFDEVQFNADDDYGSGSGGGVDGVNGAADSEYIFAQIPYSICISQEL